MVDTLKESKEREAKLKISKLVHFISPWRASGRILFIQNRKREKSALEASWWSFCILTRQLQLNGYLSLKKCTGKRPCQQLQTEASRQNVIQL